jgi:hypothetical protein
LNVANMSEPESDRPPHNPATLLIAGAAVLCALQVVVLVPNHDNAWLLELSARMLDGGKYYTDFYELNPPLYPILLLPVDLLSQATGIAPYTLFVVWVSILLYFVSRRFLTILPVIAPDLGPGARVLLALYLQACLFLFPGYDFGQRDHVAICLIIPLLCYFITEQSTGRVTRTAVIAAVCAALGVLIKPFLAGAVVLLVAVRITATRRILDLLLPVVLPAALVGASYLILILALFPEYLVMARVAGDTYSMYGTQQLLPAGSLPALLKLGVLALANEYLPSSTNTRWNVRFLLAAAAGALLSYVVQHKGFAYHLVPFKILLGITLAPIGIALLRNPGRRLVWVVPTFLAAIFLIGARAEVVSLHAQNPPVRFYKELAAKLAQVNAGNRLFFFSTSLKPEFPLNVYYPFTPSSRFPCLWTLPAALARADEGDLITLVAQDFRRWQPTAFLVDESPDKQALAQPFDFLPWFERNQQMRELLNGYQLAGRLSGGRANRLQLAIYVRKQPGLARN